MTGLTPARDAASSTAMLPQLWTANVRPLGSLNSYSIVLVSLEKDGGELARAAEQDLGAPDVAELLEARGLADQAPGALRVERPDLAVSLLGAQRRAIEEALAEPQPGRGVLGVQLE